MLPLPRRNKLISVFVLVLALIGFIDATYLTIKHYLGGPIPCAIFSGCDVVAASSYSSIGPIPLALIGSGFYLLIIILGVLYLDLKRPKLACLIRFLSLLGFIFTIYLIYLQAFVIKAFCLYCLISATTSTTIFVLALFLKKSLLVPEPPPESLAT